MKAIETSYCGYRFRSRLEARWAVFFQTLGLRWEYEPEGFDLGFGVLYLPDFRVHFPDGGSYWFEVKPSLHLMTPDEWQKVVLFDMEHELVLLDGPPGEYAYLRPADVLRGGVEFPDRVVTGFVPERARLLACALDSSRQGRVLWSRKEYLWCDYAREAFCADLSQSTIDSEWAAAIRHAVVVARQFNFRKHQHLKAAA